MSSTQHLKRTSMPNSWPVKKKNITFIGKPNSGSHKLEYVVSALVILRDVLEYASTAKEARQIVNTEEVLVNGKRITDAKFAVGIFDVIEIKKTAEKFTVLFNEFGRISLVPTKDNLIYLRVSKKTTIAKDKVQLNFMNGFNQIVDLKVANSVKVNDTIVFDFVKKAIKSTLNLKEGNFVYIFNGKFKGEFAQIKGFVAYNGLAKDLAQIEIDGQVHSTSKDYCYTIGSKAADIVRFQ